MRPCLATIAAGVLFALGCLRASPPAAPPPPADTALTVVQSEANQRITDAAATKALAVNTSTEQLVRTFAAELGQQAATKALGGTTTTPIITPPLYEGMFRDPRFLSNAALMIRDNQTGTEIWEGEPVPVGELAEAVLVSGNGRLCSGTLVGPRAIVTAAHCVWDGVTKSVQAFDGDTPTGRANVLRSVCFADCERWEVAGDIAVSFLDGDVGSVIPHKASSAQIDAAGKIVAVGFGRTEDATLPAGGAGKKRVVDITVTSSRCSGTVNGRSDAEYYRCRPNVELVAGTAHENRDTCVGDSGGGIYIRQGNTRLLAGVTSRQLRTPNSTRPCGDGGIYSRIDGPVQTWLSTQGIVLP